MRKDKAQMMVLEAITFSAMIITALLFVAELSPIPSFVPSSSHAELKTLARDALIAIEHQQITDHQNFLVECIAENDRDSLSYYLNLSLPPSTYYNIYISNGSETTLWYDGEAIIGGKFGDVIRVHRIFYYEGTLTGIDGVTLEGNIYEFIIEAWRL
ncbi:MAG TPA: hypothetical protein ENI49_05295 [Thermoplasmatales archaeon]|nr:hypothetical protein [Thermoplasmatales archaeon]